MKEPSEPTDGPSFETFLEPAFVSADDRGFLLGDGLFETIRLYAGHPFRLDRHLERLERGAELIGIGVPDDLRDRVLESVVGWSEEEAALRITLTRAAGTGEGLAGVDAAEGRVHVAIRRWRDDPELRSRGLRARIEGRIDEQALVSSLKTLGYLERIQALRVARAAGAEEALLRNTRGDLVEGSASNLLAVVDGELIAPGPLDGALPGITRAVALEIAREGGMTVHERGIGPPEAERASELIVSSSVREFVSVVEVDGRPVGGGRAGEVAAAFQRGLRQRVSEESDGP